MKKKRLLALILVCILSFSMSISGLAADLRTDTNSRSNTPSELYKSIIDDFFNIASRIVGTQEVLSNKSFSYTEYNKDGRDVTITYSLLDNDGKNVALSFYNKYKDYYKKGDYETLQNALNGLGSVSWTENSIESASTAIRAISGYVKEYYYKIGYVHESSFELLFSIRGNYTYDNVTGEFLSWGNTILTIESFNAGALCHFVLQDLVTSSSASSDRKTLIFTASFTFVFVTPFSATPFYYSESAISTFTT